MEVTGNGHLIEDNQIPMVCEKCGGNKKGKDYKRKGAEKISGWESEPIFLCDECKTDHEPYPGAGKDGIFYHNKK